MKRISIIICLVFFSLFINLNIVSAKSTASTGVNELYIRSLPTTDSLAQFKIPHSTTITLISDTEKSGNGCDKNWFQIEYDKYSGYVCSEYLTNINWEQTKESNENIDNGETTETNNTKSNETLYLQELAKFPDSYKSKIEALHKIYPNAIFKAQNINTTFDNFSTYQYKGYDKGSLSGCSIGIAVGRSLIEDTNGSRDGLKSLESWAYNPLTDTFNTSYYGGEQGRWYAPSLDTVKYYVDPRNFLNSTKVFMFEQLSYAGDYYTEENIEKMLKGTFMSNKNVSGRDNKTFAQTFLDAGKTHNVNPYFLVSRVIQEIGTTRTTMVSGTWTEYNKAYYGYYNFYNIKAAGNSVNETIKNGLAHAKSQGWNNEYDAIVGGAKFLAQDYISQGQNTTYFQKFDVYGPCYAYHQYMQNIEAPYHEVNKVYNTYNSTGLLQSNFVFVIPVYNNMPTSTSLPDSRSSNNYLRDLTINGTTINGFNYQKNEYTINVSPLISSVEIAVTKASQKSSVTGTGSFNLTGTSQTKEIVVTAQNGTKRTYKITVTKDTNIPISISEILNTMLVNSDGTYISSIKLNTKVSEFIESAKKVDSKASVTVKNKQGNQILATGDSVTITSGNDTKTFTVVIYGDLTGDGIINSADLLKMRQHLIGSTKLAKAYNIAANINKDEVINSGDLLKLRQHLIGSATIVQ